MNTELSDKERIDFLEDECVKIEIRTGCFENGLDRTLRETIDDEIKSHYREEWRIDSYGYDDSVKDSMCEFKRGGTTIKITGATTKEVQTMLFSLKKL